MIYDIWLKVPMASKMKNVNLFMILPINYYPVHKSQYLKI